MAFSMIRMEQDNFRLGLFKRNWICSKYRKSHHNAVFNTAMRILKRLGIQTSHRLSKFNKSVFVNLKPFFYFFGLYMPWFLIQRISGLSNNNFPWLKKLQNSGIPCTSLFIFVDFVHAPVDKLKTKLDFADLSE